MNPIHEQSSARAAPNGAGKWSCDFVALASGLLPPLDVVSLLLTGYLSTWIYLAWFVPAGVSPGAWTDQERTALLTAALLAAISLYDEHFGTRASRGHKVALVQRFCTGFLIFASSALVIAFASQTLDSLPLSWMLLWFTTSLLLTSLTRFLLAHAIRRLERTGVLTEVIAIVGAGPLADRLVRHLRQTRGRRIEILGVFDDAPIVGDKRFTRPAGSVADLIELGSARPIDWILLTMPGSVEEPLDNVVQRLKALAAPIALCPQNFGLTLAGQMIDYVGEGVPVTLLAERPARRWSAAITLFDLVLPQRVFAFASRRLTAALALSRTLRARARGGLATGRIATGTVVAFDDYDTAAFAQVAARFDRDCCDYVVTPNADHLIRLHDDASFRALYATAAYVLLDSRFLSRVLRVTRGIRLPVCTGSDLTAKLFAEVITPRDSLVLVGGSEAQAAELTERHGLGNLAHFNPPMGFINDPAAVEDCLRFVEAHSPFRFCLLALGSPQQEIIAQRLKTRGVARGLSLCIGASVDFLTGRERRAPEWLQRQGLEWVFRLVQEPRRMARRYLVRGPRVFGLLRNTRIVLRPAPSRVVTPFVRPLPAQLPLAVEDAGRRQDFGVAPNAQERQAAAVAADG